MSIFGSIFQAGAMLKQGEYAAKAAEYNARVLEQEKQYQLKKAKLEEEQFLKQGEGIKGRIRSGYGAGGVSVNSGSPVEVLFDTEDQIAYDAALIRYGGQVNAARYQSQANMARYQGQVSKYTSRIGAAGTLLTGLTDSAMQGYTAYKMW